MGTRHLLQGSPTPAEGDEIERLVFALEGDRRQLQRAFHELVVLRALAAEVRRVDHYRRHPKVAPILARFSSRSAALEGRMALAEHDDHPAGFYLTAPHSD